MTVLKKSGGAVRVKDADQGVVELVFATFDKIDKDGDVTLKGAFTNGAPVAISAWSHTSWDDKLPYGTGTIRETAKEAIADVQFLMDTTHGRDAFLTVKALSDAGIQEWSYSLENVEAERGDFEGKSVRFLKKIEVKEVSPLLRGAGTDTRTLATKAERKQLMSMVSRLLNEAGRARWEHELSYVYLDDFDLDNGTAVFCITDYSLGERERYMLQVDYTRTETSVTLGDTETLVESTTIYLPKGAKFSEHQEVALRGVKSLVEMAVERLSLRAAEGKSITEQTDAYERLCAELVPLKSAIDATQTPPDDDEQAAADLFANVLVASLIAQGAS